MNGENIYVFKNIKNTIYGREYIITEAIQKQVCERLSASYYKCEESKNMIFDKYKILELL